KRGTSLSKDDGLHQERVNPEKMVPGSVISFFMCQQGRCLRTCHRSSRGLPHAAEARDREPMGLYDLKTTHLDGTPADLGAFRNTVTLVVNVASECGFTPQYASLQKLHDELSGRGFAVLGFPSNEFGGQEPGSPEQISSFCERNYGVTFPLFAKVETKPGAGHSPG